MSFACHSHAICMTLVCTRMSSVCYLHLLVCHPLALVSTRMLSVCHSHVFVCHSYVTCMYSYITRMSLVCYPYVTRLYLYAIRMSLVCTRMSSVCHSYVDLLWTIHNCNSWNCLQLYESIFIIFSHGFIKTMQLFLPEFKTIDYSVCFILLETEKLVQFFSVNIIFDKNFLISSKVLFKGLFMI